MISKSEFDLINNQKGGVIYIRNRMDSPETIEFKYQLALNVNEKLSEENDFLKKKIAELEEIVKEQKK